MTRRWTPRRFVTLRRVRVTACVVSLTLASTLAFGVGARKTVALTIDGETTTVTTYAMSVDRLLQERGVKVKTHDLVESTSPTSMLSNHDVVTVRSAYQTTITINGKFWDMNQLSTAQETIEEGLLEAIGIKSDDIGKEGVMPSIGSDKDPISNTTGE